MTATEVTGLPTFLDRKLNPVTPAKLDERRAWLATLPPPPAAVVVVSDADKLALEEIERLEAEEQKRKTGERIKKLKTRKAHKDQTKGIPPRYLSWDHRRQRFYDVRLRPARRLVAIREEMGLEPITLDAALARCAEIMRVPSPKYSRWED